MRNYTGGPAFPINESNYLNCGETGMQLRDYFAAKAFAALIIGHAVKSVPLLCLVEDAYSFADAMIAERNKSGAADGL